MKKATRFKPRKDTVWGYDRYPHSPTYGRLVVGGQYQQPIHLWKRPGAKASADNLSGALRHGYEVTVTKRKRHKGATYYYVETAVPHKGIDYIQHGWIRATLLKDLGERYFDK